MKIQTFYTLKNHYFYIVGDPNLLVNQKGTETNFRPHYFAIKDSKTGLLWMAPCSTQLNKWKERIIKYKNKNRAIIVRTNARENVILFQNMFPIIKKYINQEYELPNSNEKLKIIKYEDHKILQNAALNMMILLKKGYKFSKFTPDIKRIEQMMLSELKTDKQNNNTTIPIHKDKNGIPQPIASSVNRPVIHSGYKNKPFRPHNSNNKKTHGL